MGKGPTNFVEKIKNGNGDIQYSVITGTYPDQLFQRILKEEQSRPELYPLNIDESMETLFQFSGV